MTRSFFKNVRQNFMLAPAEDKRLFLQALIWSIKVRFCIVFLPFRYYRELLGKMQTEAVNTVTDMQPTLQIKTIVSAVCRHTPWESKCLNPQISVICGFSTSIGIALVGMAGFEPAASTSQMWRDTGLRYIPNWSAKVTFKITVANIFLKKLN
jgi:hypothetical protein